MANLHDGRSTVQTFKQFEDERIYHLKLIFEYQQKEFELSRKVRRLTKELNESRKIVEMRREQVRNLKDANKSLRKSNHFYIEREKDNQGFC